MNKIRQYDHNQGLPLLSIGIGTYLMGLELVRLLNFFCAELSSVTSIIYLLTCVFCSALIASGVIIASKIVRWAGVGVSLVLGAICFCFFGIVLIYGAYLIPFTQHWRLQVSDWLLVSAICFVGVLLLVFGCRSFANKK